MSEMADLYAVDLTGAVWRKSSYTANNGNCVEVAEIPGVPGIAVRDSKNLAAPATRVSCEAWAAFLAAVDEGAVTSR